MRSSCSCSSASAKSARMKRNRHGTSSASAAKRSSAAGSRSTAMSSPSGPSRPATRRAWPPPPNVQSTATSPGCGSRSSISSPARTGTWVAVMSSRMAKAGGDVGKLIRKRLVVVRPGGAAPHLEAVARARDDDVLLQLAVVQEERRDPHPAGRVELRVQRVGREEAIQLARRLGERVHPGERGLHVRVVRLRRPHLDAPLDPLRQDDALAQRSPELRRDREPVLCVEGVVEGAAKGHRSSRAPRGEKVDADRGGGVGGAPPPRSAAGLVPHYPPLSNPTCTSSPTSVLNMTLWGSDRPWRWAIARWETGRSSARRGAIAVARTRTARGVAGFGRFRPAGVRAKWGAVGAPRGYDGPTMPLVRRRSLPALVVGLLLAAAAIAGCAASSGGSGGSDPAALVPASAPLYAEAVLNGDSQEQSDAEAALGRILRTADPRGTLVKAFDRGNVDFARDVEPWLGDRVGAAALSLGRHSDKVVVAASRDDAAARRALPRLLPDAAARSYRGVTYRADAKGRAAAVVGGFVVLGSENGLKAAVDASKGASLAETDSLKQARTNVRQERSAFLYVDVAGFLREALRAAGGGAAQLAPFAEPIAQALPKTIAAALDAEPGMLRLDSAAFGNGPRPAGASGADALSALPGDAWLGLGVGDLGGTINGFLDRVSAKGGIAGVGVQALLAQAQQGLGLDIRGDLLSWMGDAGIYLAGTSDTDRRAALVIASKDPAASQRAVRALEP